MLFRCLTSALLYSHQKKDKKYSEDDDKGKKFHDGDDRPAAPASSGKDEPQSDPTPKEARAPPTERHSASGRIIRGRGSVVSYAMKAKFG